MSVIRTIDCDLSVQTLFPTGITFQDGTTQTTAGGESILTTSNNFTNSNNFVCGDGFAAPNFTVGQKGSYGLEISFDTIPDEGAVSLLSNGQGGAGGFNFFTTNDIGEARSNILKVGNGGITFPNANQGITFESSTTTQTYPYVPNSNIAYTINASTSTNEASPTSLTGYTVLILNSSYGLTGNVYLSLPAGYTREKFIFFNENPSSYNVYITIDNSGDRITYYNTTSGSVSTLNSRNYFLVIPKQDSLTQTGFCYAFEALQNEGIDWIVSTLPLASLNMVAF